MDELTELEELLADLARDADEVLEFDPRAEAARQRIRDKLPRARELGIGPTELERVIHGIFVAKTISGMTKSAAPAEQSRGRRKRNGAPASAAA